MKASFCQATGWSWTKSAMSFAMVVAVELTPVGIGAIENSQPSFAERCRRAAAWSMPSEGGVPFDKIDAPSAIVLCRNAIARDGAKTSDSYAYLARALVKGEQVDEAFKILTGVRDSGSAAVQAYLGVMYQQGYGVPQDYVEAVRWYRAAAEQGHSGAQGNLGVMYDSGRGVTQDYAEAVRWYRKAAEQGDMTAQVHLGAMYETGHGVTQDYAEAARWFRKATEQGDVTAQVSLGVMYETGYGVTQDYAEAVRWYRKAAEQGDANGQRNLGISYDNGHGVTQDYAEAVRWYRKAADQGDLTAQVNLGVMFELGQGVTQDYSEAVRWFRKAADQGDANGQVQLGNRYVDGNGVTQDYAEAVRWFRKAAAQGDAGGQRSLGLMYETARGVAQDYSEAVHWYRKAAVQNHPQAQLNLGAMYDEGLGVTQDYAEAARWYRKAADQGNSGGQDYLGFMYENGRGVVQDYSAAVEWYRKAAEQGGVGGQVHLGFMYFSGQGVGQDYVEAARWYRKAADQGDATGQSSIGDLYEKGRGVAQDYSAAVEWYRKAAEQQNAEAQSSLGRLYDHGQGVGQSDVEAASWYRKAAEQGNADAAVRLGLFYARGRGGDQSLPDAIRWYLKAARGGNDEALAAVTAAYLQSTDPLHAPLVGQADLMATLKLLAVEVGANFEETVFDCYATLVDCGAQSWRRIDLAKAATWYRMAADSDPHAAFRLGHLLVAHPELEQTAGEGRQQLLAAESAGDAAAAFLNTSLRLASVEAAGRLPVLQATLDRLDPQIAVDLAFGGAIGRFGDDAIGPSFTYLKQGAETKSEIFGIGLISLFAFYGDWLDAEEVASSLDNAHWFELEGWDYSIDHQLSFWLVEEVKGYAPSAKQRDDLRNLLGTLQAKGSASATRLLSKLALVEEHLPANPVGQNKSSVGMVNAGGQQTLIPLPPAPEARADLAKRIGDRIAEKQALGGLSPLVARLLQQLAVVQSALGQKNEATDSILKALSISEQINRDTRHLKGSLVYHLEQSCLLSRASFDLFDLGQSETALLMAKISINELQDARKELTGLPSGLQGCFRNLVSDQYRALAGLFIQQNHPVEAEWVLGQLKDYEAYIFSQSDPAHVGDAFAHIPLTLRESQLMSVIVGLPLLDQARLLQRSSELAVPSPTAEQQVERKQILAQLAASQAAIEKNLAAIQASISEMEAAQAKPDSAKTYAKALELASTNVDLLEARLYDAKDSTAILYTVVLPDRVSLLVTTKDGTANIDIPISEDALNAQIATFRSALQNRSEDPRDDGRALYNLLFKDVDAALRKLQITNVILSLDKQLRYIPFPALYDGQAYLVETYQFGVFTASSRDLLFSDQSMGTMTVQALGASKGGDGFSPLANVVGEVDAIVGDAKRPGILPGAPWLDEDFTRSNLSSALTKKSPIIHIATHFAIGADDASSRMLLGHGAPLTLTEFYRDIKPHYYDVRGVNLLVLSACETAFGNGNELESLAGNMLNYGVRSVVATLWPVADRSTALFMARFYTHLKEGLPRGEALRQTELDFIHSDQPAVQLALRNALPGPNMFSRSGTALLDETSDASTPVFPALTHPDYWAPFIIMGQWK